MHLYLPRFLDDKRGEQAVAQVVVVLDDLYGLPVTSGGVGVLEGRSFAPGSLPSGEPYGCGRSSCRTRR